MQLRLLAVAIVAMIFAVAQTVGSGISLVGDANAYAAPPSAQQPGATVFQDEDNDEEDDDADDDNAEDDADDDNEDASDEDDDNAEEDDSADDDNTEDDDSADDGMSDGGEAAAAPVINDDALKQPLQQATGTSTGTDSTVAMPGERVALRMFSWMPAGVAVTLRPVDPNTVAAAPGTRAGDLMFVLEAKDASGTQLATLPAEANLAIRYADDTVAGLNEANLTLSRLDPTTNQWQPAPKLVREPDSNYVAASVIDLGTYVVSAQ